MKKIIAKNTGLLFLVFLTACTTTGVLTKHDKDVNFSKYKSYAWLPLIDSACASQVNDTVKNGVLLLLDKELGRRGCVSDKVNPSFLLQVELILQEKEQTNMHYYDLGGNYYCVTETVKYTQSTVLVKMIDTKSEKLVWQGWSTKRGNLRYPDVIRQIAIKIPVNTYLGYDQMESRRN